MKWYNILGFYQDLKERISVKINVLIDCQRTLNIVPCFMSVCEISFFLVDYQFSGSFCMHCHANREMVLIVGSVT